MYINKFIIQRATKSRDPLNKGIEDKHLLSLLSSILKWNSKERITSENILKHVFFIIIQPFFNQMESLIPVLPE